MLYYFLAWWGIGCLLMVLLCYLDNDEILIRDILFLALAALFGPLLILMISDTEWWASFSNKPILRKRK